MFSFLTAKCLVNQRFKDVFQNYLRRYAKLPAYIMKRSLTDKKKTLFFSKKLSVGKQMSYKYKIPRSAKHKLDCRNKFFKHWLHVIHC